MSTSSSDRVHVLAALALEVAPGDATPRDAIAQDVAGALADLIARDLAGFAPQAAQLELVTVGAHYDAVELLRPGWPLYRELEQLAARAPRAGSGGRVIAFGAHERTLAGGLAPSPEHAGGPLRLLPLLLGGDAAWSRVVGDAFERELIERGMAGAGDRARRAGRVRAAGRTRALSHRARPRGDGVRCSTNMPAWHRCGRSWKRRCSRRAAEEWLDAPPEPLVHYAERRSADRVAVAGVACALRRDMRCDDDVTSLERRFDQFQARQRQFAAVLGAHGVPVTFAHCAQGMPPSCSWRVSSVRCSYIA